MDTLEATLSRITATAAETAARRMEFQTRVSSMPASPCRLHDYARPVDIAASWRATLASGSDVITYEACPSCQQADSEMRLCEWLEKVGVPPSITHCRFVGFKPETHQLKTALEVCREFAMAPRGFLIMHGNVGNGKSHLAVSILSEFRRGRYRTHEKIVQEVRSGYGSEVKHNSAKVESMLTKACSLLVWDEFGLGASGADVPEIIHSILTHRYDFSMPTVIIFNGPVGQFKDTVGDRLESRIREKLFRNPPLLFGGVDWRGSGKANYDKVSYHADNAGGAHGKDTNDK